MKRFFFFFVALALFWTIPGAAYTFQEGSYYAQSQPGMAVVFQDGLWGMYLNGQLYDSGTYSVQSNNIYFSSKSERSYPTAEIIDGCTFSWGQSGTFVQEGCTASNTDQNTANPADYVPLIVISQTEILFYIPQLAIPIYNPLYNNVVFVEILSRLSDPNNITFIVSDYDTIENAKGYMSAIFAPQYSMIYCPYVAVIVEGQEPQIFQNIFFQVQLDQNQNVYFTLYNIYGDNMPTYSQYSSGQYNNGSDSVGGLNYYDSTTTNMYFNTMNDIMNSMHESALIIIDNINPNPQWEYQYNYGY